MRNREFERLQKKRLKKDIKKKIKEAKEAERTPKGKTRKKKKGPVPTNMTRKQIEKMARNILRSNKMGESEDYERIE